MANYSYSGLQVVVTADTRGLTANIRAAATRAGDEASRSIGSTLTKGLGRTTVAAGKAIATSVGIGAAALVGFTVKAAKAGAAANQAAAQAHIGFTALLGSGAKATKLMDDLGKVAQRGVFGRGAFLAPARNLLAVGVSANRVAPMLEAVGNAVAATGGGAQDIEKISTALGRVQVTGKFTSRTFMALSQSGVDAAALIARGMGRSVDEVRTGLIKGTIDSRKALEVLTVQMQRQYQGAADRVLNTWAGARMMLKRTMTGIGADLVAPFISPTGGGLAVKWLGDFVRLLRAVQPAVKPLVTALVSSLTPAFNRWGGIMQRITRLVEQFTSGGGLDKLTAKVKQLGPALLVGGGALSALGVGAAASAVRIPVLSDVIGTLNGPMRELGKTAYQALSQLGGAEGGATSLGAALKGIATPAGAAAVGLGLLLVVSPEFRQAVMDLAKELLTGLMPGVRAIMDAVKLLIPVIVSVARSVGASLAGAIKSLLPTIALAARLFSGSLAVALRVVAGILVMLEPVLPVIIKAFIAWKVATAIMAATQWVLNSALFAFPGTWIVAAIAAVVIAVVLAYKHFGWFRTAVQAVWGALRTFWSFLRQYVWPALKVLIALYLLPTVAAIVLVRLAWSRLGGVFRTVARAIGNAVSAMWTATMAPVLATWRAGINLVGSRFSWLWRNAVQPAMRGIGWVVSAVWTGTIRPAFNAIRNATSTVAGAFQRMHQLIGQAMNKVGGAVRNPLRFVAFSVINPFLRGANNLLGKIGLRIPLIPSFHTGGKVPGTGRGDKTLMLAEPGEWVLTRRQAQAIGYDQLRGIPHYLRGGEVGPPSGAAFAPSWGPLDWLGGVAHKAAGGFAKLGKIAKDNLVDPFMKMITHVAFQAFKVGVAPLRKLIEPASRAKIPPHLFLAAGGKLGLKALDGLVNWMGKKVAPELGAGGRGIAGLAAEVIKRFPGLSITSALRPGDPGYHGKGMARDLGGPVSLMNRAAAWMNQAMWSMLLEGIHNPGLSVKNYRRVPSSFWGPGTWAGHMDHIHMAAQLSDGPGGSPGMAFGGPAGIRSIVAKIANQFGVGWATNLAMQRIKVESNFVRNAVNRWDINWQRGTPSVGISQIIGPTFAAYSGPYRNRGPFMYGVSLDPWAQVYTMFRYSISRYGKGGLARAWGGTQGYAQGGILHEPVIGLGLNSGTRYAFGENAPRVPEAFSPLYGAAHTQAAQLPGRGKPVVINVYPQRGQSETEIAAAVNRRLGWATATGRA